MALGCKARLSKLFLELFHGTVVRKVSRKAISQNFIWSCRAKELSGRGLGRSLSYVGRSQISLSVMLRVALMHKLPCEAISQPLAWNCRAKAALQNYLLLSFCMELLFKTCSAKLFFELLHGSVMQKLHFEATCVELSGKS